jgi:DNA-binding SARP family transcriptional activator
MTSLLRLFGDIELGGKRVTAAQQRRFLANLAARRNNAVSLGALAEHVFGEECVESDHGNLYPIASRLRKTAKDQRIDIVRGPAGYTLEIDSDDCDLDVFVERAERFLATDSGSLELAQATLELWQGEPYAELAAEPYVLSEVLHLNSLRRRVEYRRVELLVRSRRFDEAIAEATRLAVGALIDMTLWLQHALAVEGTGDLLGALRLIEEFRIRSKEETGSPLSAELGELQQRLLVETGDGAVSRRALKSGPRRVAGDQLFGRRSDLDALGELFHVHRVVTILGEGGVGKTVLAAAFSESWHGPVVWCDAESARSAADFFERLNVMFEGDGEEVNESETLVVFDGCEKILETVAVVSAGVVARFSARVLSTSREPIGVSGEQQFRLGPLPIGDASSPAVALLVDRARAASATVSSEDPSVHRIAKLVDGHPLALELVARRLASTTATELIERLESKVGWTDIGTLNGRALTDVLAESYVGLSEPSKRLFEVLSLSSGGCGALVSRRVALLLGIDNPAEHLHELANKSLVRIVVGAAEKRFTMLTPVADVGRGFVVRSGRFDELQRILADAVVSVAEVAAQHAVGVDEAWWADLIGDEYTNIRDSFRHAQMGGWIDIAAPLVAAMWPEAMLRDRAEVQDWAIELVEHPGLALSDSVSIVLAIASMGALLRQRFEDAVRFANRSIAAQRHGARQTWIAHNTRFFTAVLISLGHIDARVTENLDALRDYSQRTGDVFGAAVAAYNEAMVHSNSQRLDAARPAIELTRIARRTNSDALRAMAAYSCGRVRSDRSAAIALLSEAADLGAKSRCVLVERHALRALVDLTDDVDIVAVRSRLAAVVETAPIEQQVQELLGLLRPLLHTERYKLAALVCGGLSRTMWSVSEAVRLTTEWLQTKLSAGEAQAQMRRGRRLSSEQLMAEVLAELQNA